eukprot:TRINITY_DN16177_c0_g1_i1.p1 TRINITY_DN16177_c0_g1~~TRINITY_DN16177_c0_g1_i1.p1  ORF type:complete len:422 (+),score=31.52 TRINITY_DN16177_c0_g1_i1:88-1266(+)
MAEISDFSIDLIELIFERLTFFPDMVRCGAVCRSWRSLFVKSPHHVALQFPLLFIPGDGNLLTLNDSKISMLMLEKIHAEENLIVGTFEGWLIMVDRRLDCYVVNPFSQDFKFQLPSFTTIPEITEVKCTESGTIEFIFKGKDLTGADYTLFASEDLYEYYVHKIILSSNPASSSEFMAMSILSDKAELAFCRSGDLKWTFIKSQWSYNDVIYYKDKFYAVTFRGEVVTCDIGPPALVTRLELPYIGWSWGYSNKYLVESDGELLLVVRFVDDKYVEAPYKTTGFSIFKLDTSGPSWSPVNSLGNQILFLGINCSLSVSASDSDFSGCEANHIYFTDDNKDFNHNLPWGGHDLGMFNLEDGTFKLLFQSDTQRIWPPPIWITHVPWLKSAKN